MSTSPSPLHPSGFVQFEVPTVSADFAATYSDLPNDPYCPGRSRRFSQFRIAFNSGAWSAQLLPHRGHLQSSKYNSFVGDVVRDLPALVLEGAPFQGLIDHVARLIPIDRELIWQVDAHQWRTRCETGEQQQSVPEGVHRDGHHFGAVMVLRRDNVEGARTYLYTGAEQTPLADMTLMAGQGIAFDDRKLWHNTTAMVPTGSEAALRDVIVFDFNPWDQKRYGQAFEDLVRDDVPNANS